MGLTIHYSLKSDAASPELARQLVEQLRQAALDLAIKEVSEVVEFSGPACDFHTTDDESFRWLLVQARRMTPIGQRYHTVTPIQVFAFTAWPGEGCEPANFGLAMYPETMETEEGTLATGLSGWLWHSFCKTQYASNPDDGGIAQFVRCHVTVIGLLDRAKTLGILESVTDEGGFWENRNAEALVETVGRWNREIAAMIGLLKDGMGNDMDAPILKYPNFEHLEADGRKEDGGDTDS
jgi:hypothetical protein